MRKGRPIWTWVVTAAIMAVIIWLSTGPAYTYDEDAAMAPAAARFAQAEGFDAVHDIVIGRCSMCHAAEPGWGNMLWPPKGVMLETPQQIAMHAREIYLQAGASHAMPPANVSYMEPEERAQIVAWFKAAR